MNTLTQPVIGLSARPFRGKDLGGTRQGNFTNVDPQRMFGLDRKAPGHVFLTHRSIDQGSFLVRFMIRQSPLESVTFGLAQALEDYLETAFFKNSERTGKLKPTSYMKNGILVHHSGSRITSEEVAKALAEE